MKHMGMVSIDAKMSRNLRKVMTYKTPGHERRLL